MAKYPKKVGEWAHKPYGADETSWQEAKLQCRTLLYEVAASGSPASYTDVSKRVTAIEWADGPHTHHGQQMGYLLGQVSLEELDRATDRPVLSVLVVGREEGMPSQGFWTFARDELGLRIPESDLGRLEYWVQEFTAACAFYGPRYSKTSAP